MTEYEGRTAYRCNRCHEWAFVTEADRRAANIMRTDPLLCPYCETGSLEEVGRVQATKVVSEQERTACDERCTQARGTECVCKCVSANHGTGRVIRFVRVEGTLRAVLSSIQQASLASARPKLLAQIAEFDAALVQAKTAYNALGQHGGMPYRYYATRSDLIRAPKMHSHAGRMKVLKTVIATLAEIAVKVEARDAARKNAPVAGEVYRLTGATGTPAISNGNTWAQSVVKPVMIYEMATDRQMMYINSLVAARGDAQDAAIDVQSLTKADASRYIETLLNRPVKSAQVSAPVSAPARLPEVREGRYAITENGAVTFYRIDRPTEGRWAGYTFLNAIIGGRDDRDHRTAVRDRDAKARILSAIAADADAALRLYGQTIGECGHCGRVLTDEESRKNGIGPVCAKAWA